MDQNLVASIRRSLEAKPTPELRLAYQSGDQAIWSPEAFEAMHQILSERGEVGLRDPQAPLPQRPPEPAKAPSRPKAGWTGWTGALVGRAVSFLIIPVGMYGGRFGQMILGAFGLGAAGILLFGGPPHFPHGWIYPESKRGCLYELGLLFAAIVGVVGAVAGAIIGATGGQFDWWIWPCAVLASAVLGAEAGSWAEQRWSRRRKRERPTRSTRPEPDEPRP